MKRLQLHRSWANVANYVMERKEIDNVKVISVTAPYTIRHVINEYRPLHFCPMELSEQTEMWQK